MTTSETTDRQLVWILLALLAVLILLPTLGMGFGMMGVGPMMGGTWDHPMWNEGAASGWVLAIGWLMQLLFLAVIVGAIYLGYRAVTGQAGSTDPAIEELRVAYARGDLSDEEYEQRLERLENEA